MSPKKGTLAQQEARVRETIDLLTQLGIPESKAADLTALTLLALLDINASKKWSEVSRPLRGISKIIDWINEHFAELVESPYAENTRESVRKSHVKLLVEAGLVARNPDKPDRAVNSGSTVYQVTSETIELIRQYGQKSWTNELKNYLVNVTTLVTKYAQPREHSRIEVTFGEGVKVALSPGGQNVLVEKIIKEFCPVFTPGAQVIYVGDTEKKFAFFDEQELKRLGVKLDSHGKMPDVIVHLVKKNWLVLIEAVTTHGPIDFERREALKTLFASSSAPIVMVTAFLDRKTMTKFLSDLAWETDVWIADAPSHLIHFNGERFLGPY